MHAHGLAILELQVRLHHYNGYFDDLLYTVYWYIIYINSTSSYVLVSLQGQQCVLHSYNNTIVRTVLTLISTEQRNK